MASRHRNEWLAVPQPRLGGAGLIVLMVFSMLINAISLDMYTPAIPSLVDDLATTPEILNITMVGFFAAQAISLLIAGPISDRRGRRPLFIVGSLVYLVGTIGCALAPNIAVLIVARLLQASGGGIMVAVGTAVVKDAVKPERREAILSVVNTTFIVGPVAAPVIGALVLQVATWRMIFWVLTFFGAICLLLGVLFRETLPAEERTDLGVLGSMSRLVVVMRNKGFALFLITMMTFAIPFYAYLSVASYIYIDFFDVGEMGYSMFFALSALLSSTGPVLWMLVSKHTTVRKATWVALSVPLAAGIAMMLVGHVSAWVFWVLFLLLATCQSFTRPYTTNVLLSQQEGDTGAASSLINFALNAIGCIGMVAAVAPWPNYVVGIGAIMTVAMVAGLALWVYLLRSPVRLLGVKKPGEGGKS